MSFDDTVKLVQASGSAIIAIIAVCSVPIALYQIGRNRFLQMETLLIKLLQEYFTGRSLPKFEDEFQTQQELWKWSALNLLVGAALQRYTKSLSWWELGTDVPTQNYVEQIMRLLDEDRALLKEHLARFQQAFSASEPAHAQS